MSGGFDPFSLSTGGGGLSGGSSEASGSNKTTATFGGFGDTTINFGSGTIGSKTNWWLIGGIAAVGIFLYLRKRK